MAVYTVIKLTAKSTLLYMQCGFSFRSRPVYSATKMKGNLCYHCVNTYNYNKITVELHLALVALFQGTLAGEMNRVSLQIPCKIERGFRLIPLGLHDREKEARPKP